ETPVLRSQQEGTHAAAAETIVNRARRSGRSILTEYESKQLLSSYGIPTVQTAVALNEDEAVQCANQLGYPVVLKLYSETITHKSDVGGVQLNLVHEDGVRQAYRAIEAAVRAKSGPGNFLGV